jgi:hypothetical protein
MIIYITAADLSSRVETYLSLSLSLSHTHKYNIHILRRQRSAAAAAGRPAWTGVRVCGRPADAAVAGVDDAKRSRH